MPSSTAVEWPSTNIVPGSHMLSDWPPMKERGPQIAEAAVVRFETLLGVKFPDDYRAFLLEVNGGQTELSHTRFMLVSRKGRRDWTRLNSLNSLDDPDDQFNLATHWLSSQQQHPPAFPDIPPELPDLPREVLPIGYDDFGGTVGLVVAGPRRGQVWFLDGASDRPEGANPRVDWFDRREVFKLAESFHEFMDSLGPPPPPP